MHLEHIFKKLKNFDNKIDRLLVITFFISFLVSAINLIFYPPSNDGDKCSTISLVMAIFNSFWCVFNIMYYDYAKKQRDRDLKNDDFESSLTDMKWPHTSEDISERMYHKNYKNRLLSQELAKKSAKLKALENKNKELSDSNTLLQDALYKVSKKELKKAKKQEKSQVNTTKNKRNEKYVTPNKIDFL